jgi:sulfite exporter TauE/SafE
MEPVLLLAMLALGAGSGVHCVGMCGGIVSAFSVVEFRSRSSVFPRQVLFNAGRISSYALAGAVAGTLGTAARALPLQHALHLLANVALVLVGLHLAGIGPLRHAERLAAPLWRRLQPLAARVSSRGNPYLAGLVWGWLPCGMVYGALAVSAVSGSTWGGAAAMAAFGLGTLPWLLAAGAAAARLRGWMARPAVRYAAGGGLVAFGLHGLI